MDTTDQQRKALLENIRMLPTELLQELTDFVTQLQQKAQTLKTEQALEKKVTNPYQELKEFGLIGCGEGPSDLSTNYKAYLREGFGSKREHR